MFSVTKSLIGMIGEDLVSSGILNPEALAKTYVPEFGDGAFADATVQQLFDMAVGIDYSEVMTILLRKALNMATPADFSRRRLSFRAMSRCTSTSPRCENWVSTVGFPLRDCND